MTKKEMRSEWKIRGHWENCKQRKQQSLKELHLFHLPAQSVSSTLDGPLLCNFIRVKTLPVTLRGRLMKQIDEYAMRDTQKMSSEKIQIRRRTLSSMLLAAWAR